MDDINPLDVTVAYVSVINKSNTMQCLGYLWHGDVLLSGEAKANAPLCTQRRVQPDQCYFTVQITGINFECSLKCNSTVIVSIALLLHII